MMAVAGTSEFQQDRLPIILSVSPNGIFSFHYLRKFAIHATLQIDWTHLLGYILNYFYS